MGIRKNRKETALPRARRRRQKQQDRLSSLKSLYRNKYPDLSEAELNLKVEQHICSKSNTASRSNQKQIKYGHGKKAKKKKLLSRCPQCQLEIDKSPEVLSAHFKAFHGRDPTPGEHRQFAAGGPTKIYPVSDRDWVKPRNELSGGGVSPR